MSGSRNDAGRFSDESLTKLHQEFHEHVQRFDSHVADGELRWQQQQQMWESIAESQKANATAISVLIRETRDVVQLTRDVQGAARIGHGLQSFVLWMLKWGTIGAAIVAAVTYFSDKAL